MLRFSPLSDLTGSYLLADPAREVRDLFEGRPRGEWIGTGAAVLGMEGAVRSDDLARVLHGTPPSSTLTSSDRRRWSSYSLTFAAPKPASLVFATSDPVIARAAVGAHEQAVRGALGYLEARAAGVVRGTPTHGRVALSVDGLIGASFTHGVSRSGDPHLHSHVLVANLARDSTGRFGALDQRGLRAHLLAADALYRAELRHRLAESVGARFAWGPHGLILIDGIADAEVIALSGRAAEVRSGEHGRPVKAFTSREQHLASWELRRGAAPILDDAPRRRGPHGHLDEHRFSAIVSERHPTARVAVTGWCDASLGGIRAATMAAILGRLETPLGFGASEVVLAPRQLTASNRDRRVLGARPTSRGALEAWWNASRELDRSDRSRGLVNDLESVSRGRALE